MNYLRQVSKILAWPLVVLVMVYQKTLSPDHSWVKIFYPWGYCKFHPTCSQYALIVLKTEGVIGLPKIFKRVISCTPSSLGGVDWPYNKH
jgi:putative membrane protein insertion efficiency factor